MKTQSYLSTAKQLMLLHLLCKKPTHLYDLVKQINDTKLLPRDINYGDIYQQVKPMITDKLIEFEWDKDTIPFRRVLTITQKGKEAYEKSKKDFIDSHYALIDYLSK